MSDGEPAAAPAPPAGDGRGRRGVPPRTLALAGAAALAGIAALLLVLWGLYALFGALAPAPVTPRTPEPRLAVAPTADLQQIRANEEALLNGYGWVDRQAGVVRIPIDRAMDLLAQRDLPVRGQP